MPGQFFTWCSVFLSLVCPWSQGGKRTNCGTNVCVERHDSNTCREYVDNALWSSRIKSMSLTSNSLPLMYQGFPQQTFTCRRYANSFVSDSLILDYSAKVSGWAPSLDEIDFKVKSFTRVPHHSEPRLSPWSFTLGVGYSANCSTYRFEPSVSLTLGYNLFSLFPQKH